MKVEIISHDNTYEDEIEIYRDLTVRELIDLVAEKIKLPVNRFRLIDDQKELFYHDHTRLDNMRKVIKVTYICYPVTNLTGLIKEECQLVNDPTYKIIPGLNIRGKCNCLNRFIHKVGIGKKTDITCAFKCPICDRFLKTIEPIIFDCEYTWAGITNGIKKTGGGIAPENKYIIFRGDQSSVWETLTFETNYKMCISK